jgi:hypothetical protein
MHALVLLLLRQAPLAGSSPDADGWLKILVINVVSSLPAPSIAAGI